ncbi:hypothetical protein LZ31DRAFT_555509 [Colletotrichum somersetense]|nr:hypothetical protein LZ31DRAFT_555509 [Colletotrichum somersetense]
MSSKRDSSDWTSLRRLPSVREKLSSSFVRLGRGLSRKKTMSTLGEHPDERPSMDASIKSGFPRVQVQDFGTSTLDIDLQALEAFRSVAQPPQQQQQPRTRQDKGVQKQKPPPTTSSTTPIADMFSSKRSSILEPTSGNASPRTKPSSHAKSPLAKSSLANSSSDDKPSLAKSSVTKPSPSPKAASFISKAGRAADGRRPGRGSQHAAPPPGPVVTIISSDHAQPQPAKPWPPPMNPRASAPIRTRVLTTTSDARQPGRLQLGEPPRAGAGAAVGKRHSTPSTTPGSLSVGTAQTDHLRRSWQQALPSGTSTPSGPPSASAPWRNAVDRQTSARLATDRLSWIRELEQGNKNKQTISSDLTVLKTVRGSVADKLAKFESKQQQQQQLPPLTRSNSTRSRPSSIADTFTSYGGATTTRSSLDSHRPSSVFSHYDDSFREKMEFIAGNANRKTDEDGNSNSNSNNRSSSSNEEKPATLTRVTSAFVSVEKGYKPACVDKPQEV